VYLNINGPLNGDGYISGNSVTQNITEESILMESGSG